MMGQLVITQAQREYIEEMCAHLGYSVQFALSEGLGSRNTPIHQLTRSDASELIDWLKEE